MINLIYLIYIRNFNISYTIIYCLKIMNITQDDPQAFCRPKHAFIFKKPKKTHFRLFFFTVVFCGFFGLFFLGWVFFPI